jgi:hypothetical protein
MTVRMGQPNSYVISIRAYAVDAIALDCSAFNGNDAAYSAAK